MTVETVLQRAHAARIPGYGDDEISFMAATVADYEPNAIYEWGTNRGSSARIFWEAARAAGIPCDITTIDLPTDQEWRDRDHAGEHTGVFLRGLEGVTQLRGDGATEALAARRLEEPLRAMFFIDGDHWQPTVMRELEMIHAEAPSALILLHDTHHQGYEPQGPRKAVEAFLLKHPDRYRVAELTSQAGMTRLWPE